MLRNIQAEGREFVSYKKMCVQAITLSFIHTYKQKSLNLFFPTLQKCNYCRRSSNGTTNNGACVQCAAGKCAQSFHVTCSFHNGVSLHAGDWPLPVESYCQKHDKAKCNKVTGRIFAGYVGLGLVYTAYYHRSEVNYIKFACNTVE